MNSLFLQPTTEQEIIEICTNFVVQELLQAMTKSSKIAMNVIKEIIDLMVHL